MAVEAERLIINLEARIAKFDNEMRRAAGLSAKRVTEIQRQFEKMNPAINKSFERTTLGIQRNIAALGAGIKGGIAAALAGLTFDSARSFVRDLANIGNEAKRAGLSTKAFQELSYVADQTRIPIDALVDGMKELSLRSDEFISTGAGPAAEALKRLGLTATDLKRRLQDPSALLVEIVRRLQHVDKAAQIRIADELFGGTGGERFVEVLDQGAEGIQKMIKEANDFGFVMSEEMIKKADEVDKRFSKITKTISSGMKLAIVDAVDALAQFADQFNSITDQKASTLRKRIEQNFKDQVTRREAIDVLREQQSNFPEMMRQANEPEIRGQVAELQKLEAEYKELQAALDKHTGMNLATASAVERLGAAADGAAGKLSTISTGAGFAGSAGSPRAAGAEGLGILTEYNRAQARDVAKKGILDLIGYAEGTDKGRGYNETLGYGKFTGGPVNLTGMKIDEVLALQKRILAAPGNNMNSSAVGRYQIVGKTLRGLKSELGLTGEKYFTPELQDRLAQQLLRRRGYNLAGLRNEWEGLRRVPDSAISTALGVSTPNMAPVDESVTAAVEKRKELAESYQQIVAGAVDSVAASNNEAKALGLTAEQAAALRYEQELLNQAAAAGITLTPQQAAQFKELAAGMAGAEQNAERLRMAQEEFRDIASDSLRGFIDDLRAGKSAGEALMGVLNRLADKLLDSAFNSLFGGGGGGGGFLGGLGNIFGGLFGGARAGGGPVMSSKAYLVGEKGPEILTGASGRILPNSALTNMRPPNVKAPGASGMPRVVRMQIDVTGANGDKQIMAMVQQGVQAGIGQYDKQLDRTWGSKGNRWQAEFG